MYVGGSSLLYIDQARAGAALMKLSSALSQARSSNGGQTGGNNMAIGSAQAQLTSALARVGADKAMLNVIV